ncbi:MAG: molybdenum ABC transporter ATP-binding protein [Burkholderiaceae bacterium]
MSAIIDLDVALRRGELDLQVRLASDAAGLGLFGASGSGKSTVLAIIAGLLSPDRGHLRVGGETLLDTGRGIRVPAHRRRIGLVFQDALLFPHLSVRANLRYGIGGTGEPGLFDELVALLGIERLLERRPASLSGGERQRVALGRAVLARPRLLLLDEPLAALDLARRQEIMPYLVALRRRFALPMIVVSHAIDEMIRLVDDVAVLSGGRIIDQGDPANLLLAAGAGDPGFGAVSVLEARIGAFDEHYQLTELVHPAGRISLPGRVGEPGQPYRILVRATDVAIAVARPRETSHRTLLRARVEQLHRDAGPLVRLELTLDGGGRLAALITRKAVDALAIDVGDQVYALAKATAIDDRAFGAVRRG